MAGVSSPAMAASVSRHGGLGSLGLGASSPEAARRMIGDAMALGAGPLNVNVFCHAAAAADPGKEAAWLDVLRPSFRAFGMEPPGALREIYTTFGADRDMLDVLCELRPAVVSFHFGLPPQDAIAALRRAGCFLLASATNLGEGRRVAEAGLDAVIAQGWEAGGHRGMFDPAALDDQIGTFALTRLLARELDIPVIAAGGIMDGAGIAAALRLGAAAVQLGTAFVVTDESLADPGYRAAMRSEAAHHTVMTRAISGRPARSLANEFTALGLRQDDRAVPAYPIAYDAGKALHAAGKARGAQGFGAHWAGQGAPLARPMSAAMLMATLERELAEGLLLA